MFDINEDSHHQIPQPSQLQTRQALSAPAMAPIAKISSTSSKQTTHNSTSTMTSTPAHALQINLELRKSQSIPIFLQKACTKSLIKHLLFVRRIIPVPTDDLLNNYNEYKYEQEQELEERHRLLGQEDNYNDYNNCIGGSGSSDKCGDRNGNSNYNNHSSLDNANFGDRRSTNLEIHVDNENENATKNNNNDNTNINGKAPENTGMEKNNINKDNKRGRARQYKNERKKRRNEISSRRKLMKCGQQLHFLLSDLDSIFDLICADCKDGNDNSSQYNRSNTSDVTNNTSNPPCGIKAILLTIGPSFNSPREQYVIQFHSWPTMSASKIQKYDDVCNDLRHGRRQQQQQLKQRRPTPPPAVIKKLENEISRRMICEFIRGVFQSQVESNSTNSTNINDTDSNSNSNSNSGHSSSRRCSNNKNSMDKSTPGAGSAHSMFEIRGKNGGHGTNGGHATSSSSNLKLSIACLVSKGAVEKLHHFQSKSSTATSVEASFPDTSKTLMGCTSSSVMPKYIVQRDFQIKVPRMLSRKRGIHRPYVVMNVKPMMNPYLSALSSASTSAGPSFDYDLGDTWISLQSTLKGF